MAFGFRKMLVSAAADGPTLTAAAAASCLHTAAVKTVAANFFEVIGTPIFLRLTGRISNAVTTPGTARFDLRMGGTVVFDTGAMPLNTVAKTSVPWDLDVVLRQNVIGTAANFIGIGAFRSEAVLASPLPTVGGSGVFLVPYNTAPVAGGNFNATVSQAIDVFFTQTVATGSLTVHTYTLEAPTWE